MADRWHIMDDGARYVLARRLPARFDFAVEAVLPPMRAGRLARQVRQDMWRALRAIKGFSPVVSVERRESDMLVRAGGQVDGPFPRAQAEEALADLLSDAATRARWARWAA